jgi:signal peptidase I
MLKLLKVTGSSLSPSYQEGDFVVVTKIPLFLVHLKPGDTLVFRHPDYGTLIKQIDHLIPETGEIYVVGTDEFSVDSRRFGFITKDDILGKVIWHIKRPRGENRE